MRCYINITPRYLELELVDDVRHPPSLRNGSSDVTSIAVVCEVLHKHHTHCPLLSLRATASGCVIDTVEMVVLLLLVSQ